MKAQSNLGNLKKVEMPIRSRHNKVRRGSFSKILFIKDDGTLIAKEWLYCREYFQDEFKGLKQFLFCHTKNKSKNVLFFINLIEKKLFLKKMSIVGTTQRNNISWVKPSSWWTKTSMKRSLFTALLRCGQKYNLEKDNFEEALFSCFYTKDTEYAVRRFLKGYTKYTGKKKGWYNQFRWGGNDIKPYKPSFEEINKLLIKPK